MAAINFDEMGEGPDGSALATAMNWAGALLSVLLIAGLATWGWKLWQRDVAGIPVVRALEGPMRITPDEPGGVASDYQGLSVNRIAEERAEETVDQVVLAPAPAILNEEQDLAMSELAPVAQPDALPVIEGQGELAAVPAISATRVDMVAEAEPEVLPSATDLAVAAALSDVAELVPTPASLTVQAKPGVPITVPRPIGRPEGRRLAATGPSRNSLTGEIDPTTIPTGTRLVQLGAYGSPEVARAEWETANTRFGNYLVGKERIVQEAETGGRKFWRLRASGFETLADARRFCAVLVSDGANCIPVVQE